MFTKGDIAVGVAAVLVALALSAMTGYQFGYDAAKSECKPLPRVEIPFKNMTHKQQVRHAIWMMRDRGVILK